MIKLAHIMPIENIELSAKGEIDFCLAPLCDNEQYAKYYIKQSLMGRHVILDNLIAEGKPIPTETMVKIAFEISPTEFIIPDVIGNKYETDKMRKEFLDRFYVRFKEKGIKLMAVVQGDILNEYLSTFEEINNDERIDTIGIPFRMKTVIKYAKVFKDIEQGRNRVDFLNIIKDKVKKPIHCLGCNSVDELIKLNKMNFVRSCDSKLICRYVLNNEIIRGDNMKPVSKVILENPLSEMQTYLVNYNILKLKELLNGNEKRV